MTSPRSAFTLIEMLVVIAVIAVLAAILIPVGNSMLTRARLAESTSNLRQIGLAMQNYYNDNKRWPSAAGGSGKRHWRAELVMSGYFGDSAEVRSNAISFQQHPALNCPLQSALHPQVTRKDTFAMNQNLGDQATPQPWHGPSNPAAMERPNKAALVSGGAFKAPNAFELTFFPSAAAAALPMAVYQGKANVLFVDGHVDLVATNDMPKSTTTPEGSLFWNGR